MNFSAVKRSWNVMAVFALVVSMEVKSPMPW
jgi:hypothetical protein